MFALRMTTRNGERRNALRSLIAPLAFLLFLCAATPLHASEAFVLRISDWKSGKVYAEHPVKVGSRLFFGWIHSFEKIPWNEYFHIDAKRQIILDAITFPAFGAGIPENKGRVCYIKDGLIHMEQIDQTFSEIVWLNSHTATRDIKLDDALVTRGRDLPQHTRLRLVIEKK